MLARLVENPSEVAERSRSALAARDTLVKPLQAHVDEIDAIYRDARMIA